jgi:RNA polymerase sigma-70 factor (ECF subfamily)
MPTRASNNGGRLLLSATFANRALPGCVSSISGRRPSARDSESPLSTTVDDILPRCRSGDEGAWHELVTLFNRRVFGLAYRFTGRVDEAEDLTQEIFIKVYKTLDRYREADGSFQAWLMAVARNHAIDHYRRRKQELLRRTEDPEILETATAPEEHPVVGLERQERARLVHRGLRTLPADLRLPLILCDLQGLPYDEIAATLQVPLGTVKSRINRARLELAKRLKGRRAELVGGH